MYSLIANSLVLILVNVPYILIQSIRCYPLHSDLMCYLQGFVCFTCGIVDMYTMTLLTSIQYIRLFHNSSVVYRLVEHKNGLTIMLILWFISFGWTVPPFLNIGSGFAREGFGFDCGLRWTAPSIGSRCYLFLAFICIYFIPLFFLIYTNICILTTIRRLINRREPLISKTTMALPVDVRHRLIDSFTVAESSRLKRLRVDRRFASAMIITVAYYLLAWTPYGACGLVQIALAMKQSSYQLPPILLAGTAVTAKLAVIIQPCIYFYTVRTHSRRHCES